MRLLTTLLILIITNFAKAQDLGKSILLKNIEPIYVEGNVEGYYMFYLLDQESKKNNVYRINLYDVNLKIIKSHELVEPTSLSIDGVIFNGENFAFLYSSSNDKYFSNEKKREVYRKCVFYTKNLVKVGEADFNDFDFTTSSLKKPFSSIFFNVNKKGFIGGTAKNSPDNQIFKAHLTHFGNTGEIIWSKVR